MSRGGYHADGRIAAALDEIAIEAQLARASRSRAHRDRALAEIERLARASGRLLARVAS